MLSKPAHIRRTFSEEGESKRYANQKSRIKSSQPILLQEDMIFSTEKSSFRKAQNCIG